MKNYIRCDRINTPGQSPPPTLAPQLIIMCSTPPPRLASQRLHIMAKHPLSSSSSPSQDFNCYPSQLSNAIYSLCRHVSSRRVGASVNNNANWERQSNCETHQAEKKEWNISGKINGEVRRDLGIGTQLRATAYVTCRSSKMHA